VGTVHFCGWYVRRKEENIAGRSEERRGLRVPGETGLGRICGGLLRGTERLKREKRKPHCKFFVGGHRGNHEERSFSTGG